MQLSVDYRSGAVTLSAVGAVAAHRVGLGRSKYAQNMLIVGFWNYLLPVSLLCRRVRRGGIIDGDGRNHDKLRAGEAEELLEATLFALLQQIRARLWDTTRANTASECCLSVPAPVLPPPVISISIPPMHTQWSMEVPTAEKTTVVE